MQQNAADGVSVISLTSKQEGAIDALLIGETSSQVAETVGVDRSTIHRWLTQPDFAASLNSRRFALREAHQSRIQQLQGSAIEAIEGALEQGDSRTALAVLKGTGLLGGTPIDIGPTEPIDVMREQAAKENQGRLDDLINSVSL